MDLVLRDGILVPVYFTTYKSEYFIKWYNVNIIMNY